MFVIGDTCVGTIAAAGTPAAISRGSRFPSEGRRCGEAVACDERTVPNVEEGLNGTNVDEGAGDLIAGAAAGDAASGRTRDGRRRQQMASARMIKSGSRYGWWCSS